MNLELLHELLIPEQILRIHYGIVKIGLTEFSNRSRLRQKVDATAVSFVDPQQGGCVS